MITKQFWLDTAERAVRTFAQALLALLGAGAVNILSVDWPQALSVSAGAALVSVLMSVVASGIGAKGTPSILPEAGKNISSAPAPDLDAADINIEEWSKGRTFSPAVVEADPNPADVRDTDPKDDEK